MVDQGSGENKPWHLFSSEDLKTGGHRSNLKKKRRMISISPITGTSSDSFDVTPRCPLSCITNVGQSSSIDNSTGSKNGGHRSRGKKTTVTPLSEVSHVGDLSHTQRKNSSRLSRLSGTEARTNLFEDAFISPTGKEHDTRENAVSPDDMFTYEEDFSDDSDYICSDDYTLGEDYDWSDGSNDLKNLAKQKAYLADVVGIIKNHRGIEDIVNRHDKPQKQAKFTISDGSSNVNVTFWDNYGVQFEKDIAEVKEYPIIIIIAGCKVGMWNDSIDLGNSHDTQYYFNYKHPTVLTIRKMLAKPNFSQQVFETKEEQKQNYSQ
ncbi:uncharacterized protein LOC141670683 isoform X2 [Apium graveolens]|uniref:uncharacterized protein LOC141670683 isoform X2 n=1 Tax=Apium graveolens TaxID=4045 RepID=UPI003D7A147F